MSELSTVMVRTVVPLNQLPERDLEVLRRVLFGCMEGLDEDHNRAWRRLWRRVFDGQDLHIIPVVGRHGAFHRRHMAIESAIYNHQDAFDSRRAFRWWLKTGAVFGEFMAMPEGLVFVPSSVSYEKCSDDRMREFHLDAMEFLRTPHALEVLWPSMAPSRRLEALETVIRMEKEINGQA